jgi:hypothetical protein
MAIMPTKQFFYNIRSGMDRQSAFKTYRQTMERRLARKRVISSRTLSSPRLVQGPVLESGEFYSKPQPKIEQRVSKTIDSTIGKYYTVGAYRQLTQSQYQKSLQIYKSIDPESTYLYRGFQVGGLQLKRILKPQLESAREQFTGGLEFEPGYHRIKRTEKGFIIDVDYESMLRRDPGRGAALGWGWGGLGNIDIAFYKLTGQKKKAEQRQVEQIRSYMGAKESLRRGDIGGFSTQYWSGYLSMPSTQIGLAYGAGLGVGAISKAATPIIASKSIGTQLAIRGGTLAAGASLGSYLSYYVAEPGMARGEWGETLGRSWVVGTGIAAGIGGTQSVLGVSKPKFEITHYKVSGKPEVITSQKYISIMGKRFHYGSKIMGVKPGFFKPAKLNYMIDSSITSKYLDIPKSKFLTNAIASTNKPSVEGILIKIPKEINTSGLTGGYKIIKSDFYLKQLSGGEKTNTKIFNNKTSWHDIERHIIKTKDNSILWYAPNNNKTILKPIKELYPDYGDFGKKLLPKKQPMINVKRKLTVDTKPKIDIWKWTEVYTKPKSLTIFKTQNLTETVKWTEIYARPSPSVETFTETRKSFLPIFAISLFPNVKSKTRTKTLTLPLVQTKTLTLPLVQTKTLTLPLSQTKTLTLPLVQTKTLTKPLPQTKTPVFMPSVTSSLLLLYDEKESKRRKLKTLFDLDIPIFRFRKFESKAGRYRSPFKNI